MRFDDREMFDLDQAVGVDDEDVDAVDVDPDDDVDDDASDMLYLKYCFEGAASLTELAGALRLLADDVDRRRVEGWQLAGPVEGGWAHLVRGM